MTNENLGDYGEFVSPHEVRLIRIVPAPIERVWGFLTDSEKRATWLAEGPMDLRVHGRVYLKFNHALLSPREATPEKYKEDGLELQFEGVIEKCEAPNLLEFTWQAGSEVCFELTPLGEETRIVLVHKGLKSIEETVSVAAGWHVHTAYLTARLAGQEPPLFWVNHARLEDDYATRLAAVGSATER